MSEITILGVYHYSEAYPNTKYVIDLIRQHGNFECVEICKALLRDRSRLYRDKKITGRLFRLIQFSLDAIYCHINILLRFWYNHNRGVVYIPYPAIGILLLISLLPRFVRPERIIADAFISIYDTAVIDRKLIRSSTLFAKLLKQIEKRAYHAATVITIDTDENRKYYAELFGLPVSKFVVVPLATDESNLSQLPYQARNSTCRVLFVGTFVPLQGTDIIAKAIALLKHRQDIHFTIIGNGQTSTSFDEIISAETLDNLKWIKEWQNETLTAAYISSSDICLGLFSSEPKADRVWPLKNYAYMACGRALITGDTTCARRMQDSYDMTAFVTVATADAQALANMIENLADSPEKRKTLSNNARQFYVNRLSNKIVSNKLLDDILLM